MELAKYLLVRTVRLRVRDYFYTVKGKDNGKNAWHLTMVDWGKKEQFLEKTKEGSVDVAEYGKILASGWGEDIPQDMKDKGKKFCDDFEKKFFLLKLKADKCVQTYYVLCDVGKELEMKSASSVEDLGKCGKILYSSFDEDPPEALAYILETAYFGLDSEINWNVGSPFVGVLNGELQNIQEYLNSGSDINGTDSRGWTLLHHYAKFGKTDVINFLKGKNADIQVRDEICGRKPVHIATRESHVSAIEFFLNNGALVNEADENNWTLLHYAAWKGSVKTVRFLLENHAEINAKDLTVGKKPLHIAAENGHTDVIEALLEHGASIEEEDDDARTPLYYAALMGHLETAKILIAKGANINKKTKLDTMPIHAAAYGKNTKKVMELLLDLGVNVDEPDGLGDTPLQWALYNNNLELVQFLINKKANFNIVNTNAQTPLDLCKANMDVFLHIVDGMGTVLQDEGKYNDALKCYREILKFQKEKLGPSHPETLKTLHQEAKLLYKQGQYDAALANFKTVLETRERSLGGDHIDTLATKHELGLVYNTQIKYNKAMEIFKEVYEKRKASLGICHHDTLDVARDVAFVHLNKGEPDEAFEIIKDVFEKRRANFGEDHQDTLRVKQDMAVVLVNKGDYKAALQTFKDVLQKRKNTLGDNHPDTLLTKNHISVVTKKFEIELKESNGCLVS